MIRILVLFLIAFLSGFADPPAGKTVRIAGVMDTPVRWDKEANFRKLVRWAEQAARDGAQVVIAPEGYLEGYVANDKANPDLTRDRYFQIGESIDGPLLRRVAALAARLGIYLGTGFAETRQGKMFNSFALFSPEGKLVHHYSKAHNADDEPYNTRGGAFPVSDTPFGRIGSLICYDRQLPETARILAIKGTQILLVPAWGSYSEMNDVMMRTRAYENSVWLAFVHPNRFLLIDPRGTIVSQNQSPEPQVVHGQINLSTAKGPIRHRRPDIYQELLTPTVKK